MRKFIDYGVSMVVFVGLYMFSLRFFEDQTAMFCSGAISVMLSLSVSDIVLLIYDYRKEVTEFHGKEDHE